MTAEETPEITLKPSDAEKRFMWNGRKKVNLRHLAHTKWTKFLPILNDLFYEEDWFTHRGSFYRREKGIFVKTSFPQELEKVLKERCLRDY